MSIFNFFRKKVNECEGEHQWKSSKKCKRTCAICGVKKVEHEWIGLECKRCGAEKKFSDSIGVIIRG